MTTPIIPRIPRRQSILNQPTLPMRPHICTRPPRPLMPKLSYLTLASWKFLQENNPGLALAWLFLREHRSCVPSVPWPRHLTLNFSADIGTPGPGHIPWHFPLTEGNICISWHSVTEAGTLPIPLSVTDITHQGMWDWALVSIIRRLGESTRGLGCWHRSQIGSFGHNIQIHEEISNLVLLRLMITLD